MLKSTDELQDMRDIHDAAKAGRDDLIGTLIKSENDLNRTKNDLHILLVAAKYGHAIFIRKLYEHAEAKGWQINYAIDRNEQNPFYFAVKDKLFCAQALSLRQALPDIYYIAGEGDDPKINQCLLTLLGLTQDAELKQYGMGEALLGSMHSMRSYSSRILLQRFALMLELGANPHHFKRNFRREGDDIRFDNPLSMAFTSLQGQQYIISSLLTALNSKAINRQKATYINSITKFFLNEEFDPNLKLRDAYRSEILKKKLDKFKNIGCGFVHWIAASGHVELLDDMMKSLLYHDAVVSLIILDDAGKTPLLHAIENKHHDIADRLLAEQFKYNMGIPKNQCSYILTWLNSPLINSNFQHYLQSLLQFIDEDVFEEQGVQVSACSGLVHWAVRCGHSEILADIITCFKEHGISVHTKNRAGNTSADVALQIGDGNSFDILSKIPEAPRPITSLEDMSFQTLIDGRTTISMLKEQEIPRPILEELIEHKPNSRLIRALDRKFHNQEGKTPLMVMCENNESELIVALMHYLTPEDICMAGEDGNTALHLACRSSSNEVIDLVMAHCPLSTRNNSGLIPILCADSARRQAIIEHDASGNLFQSLFHEVEENIAKIVDAETQRDLSTNNGFFSGFSSYNRQAQELSQSIKASTSSRYRGPSLTAITLLCRHLENPGVLESGYYSFQLLQAINNNTVLRTALNLPHAALDNQDSSLQYCRLVVQNLNRLCMRLQAVLHKPETP